MYKFRAWDKKEKKFHYFEGIFNQRPYTEKSTFLQYDSSPEYHELILEQFTGLHDRNGKEIYENDNCNYISLCQSHSDAVNQFGAEPQNNFPVHEVYTEIKSGVVKITPRGVTINDIVLCDIQKNIWNALIELDLTGGLNENLRDFIREDKQGFAGSYKEYLKQLEVISNIYEEKSND